jgi:hypothetical protein
VHGARAAVSVATPRIVGAVLVVPGSSAADLAIIRSLGRKRVRVVVAVTPEDNIFRVSRYCAGTLPMPDHEEAGVEAIVRGVRRPGITHLICAGERLRDYQDVLARDLGIPAEPQTEAEDVAVTVLLQHGNPGMVFQYRRPANYVESMAPDRRLVRHSVSILRALEWDGFATIRFERDPLTGAVALSGLTGGFQDALALALRCGADLPYQLYLASLGHRLAPVPYQAGVRCGCGLWAADDPLPYLNAVFHRDFFHESGG